MDINQTTEEMIQMFLKYGTKQSLSVDEFLLLRKQVVDEALSGVKINNQLQDTTNVNIPQQIIPQEQKTIVTSQFEVEEIRSEKNEIIPTSTPKEVKQQEDKEKNIPSIAIQNNQKKINKPIEKKNKEVIMDDAKNEENFEEENFEEEFSDKDFLAMMRQVED